MVVAWIRLVEAKVLKVLEYRNSLEVVATSFLAI